LPPIGTALALEPTVRLPTRSVEHTTIVIRRSDTATAGPTVTVPPSGVEIVAVERALIQFALDVNHGNRTRAAQFLGLSRSALLYRMQKYQLASEHLPVPDIREQS
jgi:DNA-binding NtrC family response regulator